MRASTKTIALIFLVTCLSSVALAQTAAQKETAFKKVFKAVVPKKTALWETVPWEINILDAKAKAEESNRLVFMWSMDGHPMGCV